MKTILNEPIVYKYVDGLTTQTLGDIDVDELKFKDTTGVVDTFGHGALTGEGETPLDTMVEVGVDISPEPSP